MSKLKWEQLKGHCRRAKDIATFGPERKPPVEQSILPRTKQQNDPICKRCGCVTRRKTHDGPVPGKTMWYAWWFRCSRCGWQFMPKEAIRTLPSTQSVKPTFTTSLQFHPTRNIDARTGLRSRQAAGESSRKAPLGAITNPLAPAL